MPLPGCTAACHPCHVGDEDRAQHGEEPRRKAIMAFLGAGLHQAPTPATAVPALASARRMVTSLLSRHEPITPWLANEIRLRGIRENAAILAVMEMPEYRHGTAQAYARDHPERLDVLRALLAVLA
jgi:hypothetical protein